MDPTLQGVRESLPGSSGNRSLQVLTPGHGGHYTWITLPEVLTANAPENGWLEYYIVSFWNGLNGLFSGAFWLVSREGIIFFWGG